MCSRETKSAPIRFYNAITINAFPPTVGDISGPKPWGAASRKSDWESASPRTTEACSSNLPQILISNTDVVAFHSGELATSEEPWTTLADSM